MEDNKFKPQPKLYIKVGKTEYGATAFLSVRDMEYIAGVDFNQRGIDCKEITLSILVSHLIDYPEQTINKKLIYDSEIGRFIEAYIDSSDELKSIYIENRTEDIFEQFVNSLRIRTEDLTKQMVENLRPALQDLANAIKLSLPPIPKLVITPQLQESLNAVSGISKFYTDTIQTSMVSMAKVISDSINRMLPDYSQTMNSLAQTMGKFAEVFRSPLLSNERKKELQEAFTQWGKFGWTLPPNADLELFYDSPSDEKEAFEIVQPYIDKGGMQFVFDILLEMKHIRKSDMKEAIADYEDKRYKSCIMILFSLIDARIIRLQEKKEGKRRPSGYKGANKYFEKVDADEMIEMSFADALYKYSILSSLSVVFEAGDDFKKQPDVINRNFIDHGMLHRNVTQRDCKKVFLLLYNFVALVEDLENYEG